MIKLDKNLRDRIAKFEGELDDAVSALPLAGLPMRAMLATLHYFLFSTFHGPTLANVQSQGVAETTAGRLGYLLPLIARAPAVPYGASARDAVIAAYDVDPDGKQLAALLAYAHFAQIMPEVWRGYYQVAFEGENHLRLAHCDEEFARHEGADILLSDLAMPFRFHRRNNKPDPDVAQLAQLPEELIVPMLGMAAAKKAAVYRHGQAEATPIEDSAMKAIFEFDSATFRNIQTSLLGLAEDAEETALFKAVWSLRDSNGETVSNDTAEWLSLNLRPEIVVSLLEGLSGATSEEINLFIDAFAIDFRKTPPEHRGGDGFFPPFARSEGALLFSPFLVMCSVSARNAVYGFSEIERRTLDAARRENRPAPEDRFGAFVANVLEPQLLEQAIARLPAKHPWTVLLNVPMPGGEIDMVLVDRAAQFALCLQAKAPLPPQGARMTQRLQERVQEGILQIDRFCKLPLDAQRCVIEARLSEKLPNLQLRHGLLTPACFGASAWSHRDRLLLLTPAVIGLAAKAWTADDSLEHFAGRMVDELDAYLGAANYRWEIETIQVLDREISVPLLKFDDLHVELTRERAWPGEAPSRLELPDFVNLLDGVRAEEP